MKLIVFAGALLLCAPWASAQDQPAPLAPKPEASKPEAAKPQAPPPAATKPPAAKSTFEESESVFSVSVFNWFPDGNPRLRGGKRSVDPNVQGIDMAGHQKNSPGIRVTIPATRSNRFEVEYWESRREGGLTAKQDYNFFGQSFDRDMWLVTESRIRAAKFTWNYLTYPYPPLGSRLRVKTLWEFQAVSAKTTITAPYTATSDLSAIRTSGRRNVFMPTLGLGIELLPSLKHFRVEAKASGMGLPGKSRLWDAEGTATLRVGPFEAYAGGKIFDFRTNPNDDQYVAARLWGPFAGVRWVFR